MNIQKIYSAVEADEMNSPLLTIVNELEEQGYKVRIEGLDVSAGDMEDKLFKDIEKALNKIEIELLQRDHREQKFRLVFTDYHKFNFQDCPN